MLSRLGSAPGAAAGRPCIRPAAAGWRARGGGLARRRASHASLGSCSAFGDAAGHAPDSSDAGNGSSGNGSSSDDLGAERAKERPLGERVAALEAAGARQAEVASLQLQLALAPVISRLDELVTDVKELKADLKEVKAETKANGKVQGALVAVQGVLLGGAGFVLMKFFHL